MSEYVRLTIDQFLLSTSDRPGLRFLGTLGTRGRGEQEVASVLCFSNEMSSYIIFNQLVLAGHDFDLEGSGDVFQTVILSGRVKLGHSVLDEQGSFSVEWAGGSALIYPLEFIDITELSDEVRLIPLGTQVYKTKYRNLIYEYAMEMHFQAGSDIWTVYPGSISPDYLRFEKR